MFRFVNGFAAGRGADGALTRGETGAPEEAPLFTFEDANPKERWMIALLIDPEVYPVPIDDERSLSISRSALLLGERVADCAQATPASEIRIAQSAARK